jgi:hypothetical protein
MAVETSAKNISANADFLVYSEYVSAGWFFRWMFLFLGNESLAGKSQRERR